MRVPGEPAESQDPPLWIQGPVRVVYVPKDLAVWRYMPLEQLFALLLRRAIHFSPLCSMEDTTEGKLPPQSIGGYKDGITTERP